MVQSMFGFTAENALNQPANLQTTLWIALAALSAFLLPNTKDISEIFQTDLLKRPSAALYGLGTVSGVAAAFAFFASLSLTQSPFLYFNF